MSGRSWATGLRRDGAGVKERDVGDTRTRIVAASSRLFSRNGYAGTGIKQIVQSAAAPFGSVYHFFPLGKQQIAEEAIRTSGASYLKLVQTVLEPTPDLPTGVVAFFAGAAQTLVDSGYEDACPIATVALEVASVNEPLRQATADVFDSWIAWATDWFVRGGVTDAQTARSLGIAMIGALEGAFVLSRALRSTEPLTAASDAVLAAVHAALARD